MESKRPGKRAQTNIEYILLLAGIIGVSIIVILIFRNGFIPSVNSQVQNEAKVVQSESCFPVWEDDPIDTLGVWHFDDGSGASFADSSGRSYNGIINDVPWLNATYCESGNCIGFNGMNTFVNASSPVNTSNTTGDGITISAWVDPASITSLACDGSCVIYSGGLQSTTSPYNLLYIDSTDHLHFQYWDGASGPSSRIVGIDSNVTISTNQWSYVTVSHDYLNQYMLTYVNGVLEDNESLVSDGIGVPLLNDYSTVGAYYTGTGDFFNGSLEEVQVYNHTESPNDALNDMLSYNSSGAYTNYSSTYYSQYLLQYYTMDDGTGFNVSDSSGNNNYGILRQGLVRVPQLWQPICVKNGCISLDGVRDYGYAPAYNGLNSTLPTFEAWVDPANITNSSLFYIASKLDEWNASGWGFGIVGSSAICGASQQGRLFVYNGTSVTCGVTALPVNAWSFVAFTNNGTYTNLYINSVLDNYSAQVISPSTGLFGIGSLNASNTFIFNGSIDEAVYYNRSLSSGEINLDLRCVG